MSVPVTGTCRIALDLRDLRDLSAHAAAHRSRLLLGADVLRRYVTEFRQRPVLLAVVEPGDATPAWADSGQEVVGPVWRVGRPDQAIAVLGGPPDVVVEPASSGIVGGWPTPAPVLRVGAVAVPTHGGETVRHLLDEQDPTTVRLALLRYGWRDPAGVSIARLHRAEQTLDRWRFKVAMWHDMPAAAPVRDVLAAADAALETDLDTGAVLHQLHRLEIDQQVASGAKFETFVHLDRVLGLDLGHLIGKLHR